MQPRRRVRQIKVDEPMKKQSTILKGIRKKIETHHVKFWTQPLKRPFSNRYIRRTTRQGYWHSWTKAGSKWTDLNFVDPKVDVIW